MSFFPSENAEKQHEELRELRIHHFTLKEQYDTLREKMKFFTRVSLCHRCADTNGFPSEPIIWHENTSHPITMHKYRKTTLVIVVARETHDILPNTI
jgi:hypothetical protein